MTDDSAVEGRQRLPAGRSTSSGSSVHEEGPYTPSGMDAARGAAESRDSRFDELYAEAKSTLGYGANNLRSVTERYREAYRDTLGRWHRLRDQLDIADRAPLLTQRRAPIPPPRPRPERKTPARKHSGQRSRG